VTLYQIIVIQITIAIISSKSIWSIFTRRRDLFHVLWKSFALYFSSDAVYSAAVTHWTLPSFSIRNFHVLDTTFKNSRPVVKFCREIYGIATARSWNFLNDTLLELVVRERAKGKI